MFVELLVAFLIIFLIAVIIYGIYAYNPNKIGMKTLFKTTGYSRCKSSDDSPTLPADDKVDAYSQCMYDNLKNKYNVTDIEKCIVGDTSDSCKTFATDIETANNTCISSCK